MLMSADNIHVGLGNGMFCHKDGTAVLKGKDGGLEGIDFLGYRNNFLFVKANQGAIYRQLAYFVGSHQGTHGLGSYLTDTLTCNQSEAAGFLRDMLRIIYRRMMMVSSS